MPLYLGIDGGGSHCRALVQDENGQTIFRGQGGPANFATCESAQLDQSLSTCLQECPPVDAVAGCFAGILTHADHLRAKQTLDQFVTALSIGIWPDYCAMLQAENSDGIILAGTGSAVVSRKDHKFIKSGGGGYLLGDLGSCFDLGKRAIYACFVSGQYSPSDALVRSCSDLFGTEDPPQIVANIYKAGSPGSKLASLAPTISFDFDRREPYARAVVRQGMHDLASEAHSHIIRHHDGAESLIFCLTGGLWAISNSFSEQFISEFQEISQGLPAVTFPPSTQEPVMGAVALAQEMYRGH